MLHLLQQAMIRVAERRPDHIAFRCRGQSLTYGELELQSNRLAHTLIEDGVRRGDRVGIYTAKSLHVPVAIYGILKAGAAYVPLDPLSPVERIARITRNCGLRVIVSEKPKAKMIRELQSMESPLGSVVGLAEDDIPLEGPQAAGRPFRTLSWEQVASAPDRTPSVRVMEQDLCYVLYTSGSTAEPKGIMHNHRSALSWAEVSTHTYGFHEEDRISNHAPLHFDLSTLDYFSTAVAGATTIIIPEEYTKFPASLSTLMEDEGLTVLYAVPLAMIHLLLHGALESRNLDSLRWMLFGGEPFPPKHLRELMRRLPQARFSNVYGPTEVNGCNYFILPSPPESDEPIPIGGLYDNAEGLVVDEDDVIVPPGKPGELLIRSGTRMVGYWGRPEQTEAATYRRTGDGGQVDLFHRTGDLVEELAEGGYRFLGRKDRQIKTRGHRVELDEVEAVLAAFPDVVEAAVFSLPDGEGSQLIRAAVVPSEDSALDGESLRERLRNQLPVYSIPLRIDVHEAFPRTSTGKTDRRRLRTLALEAEEQSAEEADAR